MKVEKKENQGLRAAMILNGLVALIWVVYCVLDVIYDTDNLPIRVLRILCAVLWCTIFVVSLRRYWKDKKERQ